MTTLLINDMVWKIPSVLGNILDFVMVNLSEIRDIPEFISGSSTLVVVVVKTEWKSLGYIFLG